MNRSKRPSFYHHLHPPAIPAREARFRYTFGLGGISILLFVTLFVTGALETIYYIPGIDEANDSLQRLTLLVPYGWLIRSLHYWAAQLLLVTATLHMLRVVFTGAYKSHRRFNWLLGLALLVIVLIFDFTGYALRWDTEISWALMVGTNLLRSIPVFGEGMYGLVVGGGEIGRETVVRFYGWHIYGLTIAALVVIAWHIFRVRRDGGISRAAIKDRVRSTIPRDELIRREAQVALAASILLLVVAVLFPPQLGPPADFQNLPPDAAAPWFFLWIQQLLRRGSAFLMGILIPAVVLLILALLPYVLDKGPEGVGLWFNRQGWLAQAAVLLMLAFILFFSLQGIFG